MRKLLILLMLLLPIQAKGVCQNRAKAVVSAVNACTVIKELKGSREGEVENKRKCWKILKSAINADADKGIWVRQDSKCECTTRECVQMIKFILEMPETEILENT